MGLGVGTSKILQKLISKRREAYETHVNLRQGEKGRKAGSGTG